MKTLPEVHLALLPQTHLGLLHPIEVPQRRARRPEGPWSRR
jgi:hypothetical protein